MYYTIIPHEIIFDEDLNAESQPQRKIVQFQNVPVVIEQNSESEYQIVQILSSNPQDFLSENIQPGKKVTLQPLLR